MFCTQCGSQVEQHFRFCSRCGHDLTPVSGEDEAHQKMARHVIILGWIFIGTGILCGVLGMLTIFASQLLAVLPIEWPADVPFDVSKLAVSITIAIGLAMVAVAAGIAAAGAGLLYYKTWGRIAAIIMGIIMILDFPIGTAIGIYALWVLLSEPGREHFRARAALAQS